MSDESFTINDEQFYGFDLFILFLLKCLVEFQNGAFLNTFVTTFNISV